VTCDTVEAASHIYSELDGTELERSANVFDLSFVPDDMSFDDECRYALCIVFGWVVSHLLWSRDEASDDPSINYKGIDFVTDVRIRPTLG